MQRLFLLLNVFVKIAVAKYLYFNWQITGRGAYEIVSTFYIINVPKK